MNKITSLIATRKGDRVNIYINDKYEFTIQAILIVDYSLFKGKELSEEEIEKIKTKDFEERIYIKSVEKIARRPHSQHEIERYLYRQLYKYKDQVNKLPESADIIQRLTSRNYLNDKDFCQWFVDIKKGKYSTLEIKKKLLEKRVSGIIIDQTISGRELDDLDLMQSLIDKKLRQISHKNYSESETKKKLVEFLIRKGYQYTDILRGIES